MTQQRFPGFVWLLAGSFACGGAEFTTVDNDAGMGGASSSSSSTSMTSGTSATSSTTGPTTTSSGTSGPSGSGSGGASTTGSGGSGMGGSPTTGTTGGTDGGATGGSAGSGTGGGGGQTFDARPDGPVPCSGGTLGQVKFLMTSPSGMGYCVNTCSNAWISILPSDGGQPLAISGACTTTCQVCQPIACGPCAPPQLIKPQGETFLWDGTIFAQSHCGPQNVACVNQLCLPPGRYVARMCAIQAPMNDPASCINSGQVPTCVDVPFNFPTTDAVQGRLP